MLHVWKNLLNIPEPADSYHPGRFCPYGSSQLGQSAPYCRGQVLIGGDAPEFRDCPQGKGTLARAPDKIFQSSNSREKLVSHWPIHTNMVLTTPDFLPYWGIAFQHTSGLFKLLPLPFSYPIKTWIYILNLAFLG